jgi:CubicO group peptidase (beta-lactamase class C family)
MEVEVAVKEICVFLKERVAAEEFSGCVLVARNATPIFREAYGFASKRYSVRNQIDTKFNLGSCNKIFTKVAIMQLAERGKLSLGDYVSKHLPNYPSEVASRVTINHLLNHSSGMSDYWNKKFEASKHKLRTVDDFMHLFIDDPLSFEPGRKIQYSNNGYVVLGKIVEAVSGQDYYDYVREHIYKPAGMNDSDHYEMDMPIPNLAMGYTRMDEQGHLREGPRKNNLFMIGVKGSPAGGGYSTVDDMLRFCIALHDYKLINPRYTDLVYLPPTLEQTNEETKRRSFGHSGGAPGVGATFKMYFDSDYIKIILSNYDPEAMETVSERIENMILHAA